MVRAARSTKRLAKLSKADEMKKESERIIRELPTSAIAFLLEISRMTAWRIKKGKRKLTVDEFDKLAETQLRETIRSTN
jgi:cell division protein FtsB